MGTISTGKPVKYNFFSSIKLKLLITYLSVILAILALLNTYPLTVSRELIFNTKKTFLINQASIISTSVSTAEELTSGSVAQIMDILEIGEIDTIVISDSEGTELYRASTRGQYAPQSLIDKGTIQARMNNDYFHSSFENSAFASCASMPVTHEGSVIGTVFVYEYDESQGALLVGLKNDLERISILVSIVAIVLCFLVTGTITRPITRLMHAVKNVREGEYNYRVEVKGNDELAVLTGEFNDLTQRLQSTEEVRRRFVADASHELKTPLASIRLLTDSILQNKKMGMDTVQEFVSDIGNEAWRLTRTTEKLQTLTRLDYKAPVERTNVKIANIVNEAVTVVRPIADSRGITINCNLDTSCQCLASEETLYQIIQNLTENSVKYNLPDGRVDITLVREGNNAVIKFADTGIGIPDEDMAHIFDRFYRVDKARSREDGGSGLGLSIVKSSVDELGGTVYVSPRPSGGTVFTVILPLSA